MKRRVLQSGAAALAITTVAACSSYPEMADAERLALYRAHAGAPVGNFRYVGRSLSGWTPLGDEALAVWTRPGQAFLLDLTGPCMGLEYAPTIGLSNLMGQVSAPFDRVLVYDSMIDSARMPASCFIKTIRPLDVKTLKLAEKELREAKVVEREAQPSGT